MKRNYPKIEHIRIDLDEDLIYSHGVCIGSWSRWKSEMLEKHRDVVMQYKLYTKYNFDKAGSISHKIAWDSVVQELIDRNII